MGINSCDSSLARGVAYGIWRLNYDFGGSQFDDENDGAGGYIVDMIMYSKYALGA
jgi:hypothetical protein